MARPLSQDLRQRVAAALAAGETTRATAKRFGVSVATAVRIGQKWRSGRGLQPGKMGGHRRPVLRGDTAEWVRGRLADKGDLTMRALAKELAARGVMVTHDTVWRFVRSQGLTFKKNAGGHGAGWATGGATAAAVENPSGET
jgi:transposase